MRKKMSLLALLLVVVLGSTMTSFASSGQDTTIYNGMSVTVTYSVTSTQIDGGILCGGADSCSVTIRELVYKKNGTQYTTRNVGTGTGPTSASIRLKAGSGETYVATSLDYRVNGYTVYGKINARP